MYQDIQNCGKGCTELNNFDSDIEKDLLRTFPKVPQFKFNFVDDPNENENYRRLKRVLSSFAYYDHGIGYM
jgi:hypothetical protein